MPAVDRERLGRRAGRNFGVFTRGQARACGYSWYQIRRPLDAGEWQTIVGSAFALAGLRVTPTVRDRAAQLCVAGSVLAGASAARTWQIEVPDRTPCPYVGVHGGPRIDGVRLIFETPAARDVSLYQGLPTTGRGCAVVDSLRFLAEPEALRLLDRALQQGWLTVRELVERVNGRAGQWGVDHLRRLVRQVRGGERSAAERRLTGLLRMAGIQGWQTNMEISHTAGVVGVGDLVFKAARLVVEVDGWGLPLDARPVPNAVIHIFRTKVQFKCKFVREVGIFTALRLRVA